MASSTSLTESLRLGRRALLTIQQLRFAHLTLYLVYEWALSLASLVVIFE